MFKNNNNEDKATSESKTVIWTTSTHLQSLDSVVETEPHVNEFKSYKRRWMVLAIFCLSASSSVMQFMMYSVVADSLVKYYDITFVTAGWSSMTCMISYLLCAIPGSYIMDAYGFRSCVVLGITVTCIGSWIKVFSIDPSRYWVLLLGQGVAASVQVLFYSLPLKLAAVWFGSNEVSTACAIAIIGVQSGTILGMLIPPLLVEAASIDEIASGFTKIAYLCAIFTTILFVVIIFGLPDAPPTPPSLAQYKVMQKERSFMDYFRSIKSVFCNRSHNFLLISSGIVFGLLFPIIINFNQVFTFYFPEDWIHVGYVLTVYTLSGLVGMFVAGLLLDKYHAFRCIYITLTVLSALSVIVFLEMIPVHVYASYGTSIVAGMATFSLYAVALELGVELTYPEPQSTSATLISATCQISGLVFTYLQSYLFSYVSERWANICFVLISIIGIAFLFGIKYNLKRYNVEQQLKPAADIEIKLQDTRGF